MDGNQSETRRTLCKVDEEVAINSSKRPINCWRRQRNITKPAEPSGEQGFMKCFAESENGTPSAADFILMRLVANWTERCKGGNICMRSKVFEHPSQRCPVCCHFCRSFRSWMAVSVGNFDVHTGHSTGSNNCF